MPVVERSAVEVQREEGRLVAEVAPAAQLLAGGVDRPVGDALREAGAADAREQLARGRQLATGTPEEELRLEGDQAALSGSVWQVGRRKFARAGTVSG